MSDTVSHEEKLDKLREIIKKVDICMLATSHGDGSLHSRPMSNNKDVEFDGDLWFFAHASSHVVDDIERQPQVSAGFADVGAQRYASLSGKAEIVRDRARTEELWQPVMKAWFPDGPQSPDLALIKVHAERAEYWDASKGGIVAQAISLVSALVSGKEADYGDNEKVELG